MITAPPRPERCHDVAAPVRGRRSILARPLLVAATVIALAAAGTWGYVAVHRAGAPEVIRSHAVGPLLVTTAAEQAGESGDASTAAGSDAASDSTAGAAALADTTLAAALEAARARLASWEPVVADPTRLDALRAAVATGETVAAQPEPAPADVASAAAELTTRTGELPEIVTGAGPTTVGGIVVASKTFAVPEGYDPGGLTPETQAAFTAMASEAWDQGVSLWIESGYRSYADQRATFDRYAAQYGAEHAEDFSSRPGHSEHQTGLSLDVNNPNPAFGGTAAATWVAANAHRFGFVVRYPDGKEDVTGYSYEPWHLRYLGVDLATQLVTSGLTLEDYLGVTSRYR